MKDKNVTHWPFFQSSESSPSFRKCWIVFYSIGVTRLVGHVHEFTKLGLVCWNKSQCDGPGRALAILNIVWVFSGPECRLVDSVLKNHMNNVIDMWLSGSSGLGGSSATLMIRLLHYDAPGGSVRSFDAWFWLAEFVSLTLAMDAGNRLLTNNEQS
jgi:hypothetical protein